MAAGAVGQPPPIASPSPPPPAPLSWINTTAPPGPVRARGRSAALEELVDRYDACRCDCKFYTPRREHEGSTSAPFVLPSLPSERRPLALERPGDEAARAPDADDRERLDSDFTSSHSSHAAGLHAADTGSDLRKHGEREGVKTRKGVKTSLHTTRQVFTPPTPPLTCENTAGVKSVKTVTLIRTFSLATATPDGLTGQRGMISGPL